jgi:uncharacterized lipoprotein YddW (UPF0748 family)
VTGITKRARSRDLLRGDPSARGRVALLGIGVLCALACGPEPAVVAPREPAPVAEASPRRALWVLAEGHARVLDDAARVPGLIATARRLRTTDLFVQVYRGGRAWYDATLADATPYALSREASGADALAQLVAAAHAEGMRVHAWVNVLSLAKNRDAPILDVFGEAAVLVDRRGRSLLDYPGHEVPHPERTYVRMGTPGIYLDPGLPGLAEHLTAVFEELLRRYPALDGLHLDYIRYPDVLPFAPGTRFGVGLDFGYGPATRARFRDETGLEAPFGDSLRNANAWDAWRRDQVTGLVRAIGERATAVRPGIVRSAAVWTYANRAYLSLGQDWRAWLEADLIDVAVPMSYTLDDRLLRYQIEHFTGLPQADRIWIGLGTWLFAGDPARALAQIALAERSGAGHVSLFSYDSIVAEPALLEALTGAPNAAAAP